MTRKFIANTLRKKRHNLKQVREALKLIEDLSWRICWAQDFSQYMDINDALDPIGNSLSDAQEELEHMESHLEEQLQEYRDRINMAHNEIVQEVFA
jgi:RNA polymerase-binding transcription factor DksA